MASPATSASAEVGGENDDDGAQVVDAAGREQAFEDSAPLRELCEANGLKKADFVQRAPQQRHLDSFMGTTMADLWWARYFHGLSSLCVMKESALSSVAGIESLPGLETLWVTECALTSAAGVERCARLENLHLSGNALTAVTPLAGLTNLQLLWINDNRLVRMPDTSLGQLRLARSATLSAADALNTGHSSGCRPE